jgi:gliding motility-associated-like protein
MAFVLTSIVSAQQFTDAASYDAWKADQPVTVIPPPVDEGEVEEEPTGQRSNCNCWIEPDASYTTINNATQWNASGFQNADDGNFGPVNLPFAFQLYSNFYNQVYISTNGILVFGGTFAGFTANGFPLAGNAFVAPFWADIDLRGPGGGNNIVKFKVTPTALYVNYINVGYYNQHVDKLNTFQVIITNATDPVVPNGANVSFCYQDMQWTTGDANGGNNGFGGNAAANVGANQGNGINYMQFGRFNQAGTAYNGPFGAPGGVSWLDDQHFIFNTIQTSANIPPIISSTTVCDSLTLCVGEPTTLEVTFLSPEPAQTTIPTTSAPTLSNWTVTGATPGNTATITVDFTPTIADVGFHQVQFFGADNGVPALTSNHDLVIHVLPVSQIDTVDLAICEGGPPIDMFAEFSGTALPDGTWEDPNGAVHSGSLLPGTDPDGAYIYLEPFITTCPSSGVVMVSTNDLSNTIDSTAALCFGSTDGIITVTTAGNGGPWNYTWTDGAGNVVQSSTAQTGDVFNGGVGSYTVVVEEGPNGAGCTDTLTSSITEPPPLAWLTVPLDTLICFTGSAQLSALAEGGFGAIAYQWSHGPNGTGPHAVNPLSQTNYAVIVTDANGCVLGPVDAIVDVREPFTLDPLINDTTCFNIPATFSATGYSGGDGAYRFDWGFGPLGVDSVTMLPAQSTTVCVTLSDGCETPPITTCAWLEVLHVPAIELTADTTFGCVPFAVRFTLTDTTYGAWVEWAFGDDVIVEDTSSVVHTYADAGNFDVGLTITWPNDCVTDTLADDMVRTLTIPTALLTWTPNPATINDPIVHFQDLSVPNVVSWWWDFGYELGTSTEQDPVIEFPNEVGGSYPITLVVANELGCTDTLRTIVDVHDEFMVWVPNAFTPNAEGPNETFFVSGNDLSPENYLLIIFDRWGHEVFNTTDLYARWDGTFNGSVLPQGLYVYRLKVTSLSTPKKKEVIGHVNLLR